MRAQSGEGGRAARSIAGKDVIKTRRAAGRGDETEATVLGAKIEQIALDEGDRAEPQFGRIALRGSETGAAEVDRGDREAGVGAREIDRLVTGAAAGDEGRKRGGG